MTPPIYVGLAQQHPIKMGRGRGLSHSLVTIN